MAVRLRRCSNTTTDAGYFLRLTELRTEALDDVAFISASSSCNRQLLKRTSISWS
jgi:hypothetical protein